MAQACVIDRYMYANGLSEQKVCCTNFSVFSLFHFHSGQQRIVSVHISVIVWLCMCAQWRCILCVLLLACCVAIDVVAVKIAEAGRQQQQQQQSIKRRNKCQPIRYNIKCIILSFFIIAKFCVAVGVCVNRVPFEFKFILG